MKKIILTLLILLSVYGISFGQASWTFVSTVPGSPNINSISVVDANLIWAACDGGSVFKSTNAGVNWTSVSTGLPATNLYGISALDASNCWVGTGAGAIYRTTDGGTSWASQVSISGSFINGVKMFDANYGIFTGDPTGNGQPYQNRYTTNGGANWILAPNSPIGTNEFGVINAWDWLDTNTIWIGSANTVANATTAKIFKTSTGYSGTWSFATVLGTGGSAGLYYQAIAFTDANNGMSGSNGNNFVKTTDGGVTWTSVSNPAGVTTFAAINMYGFKDGSNRIRVSINETTGYRMFTTTNYGTTWTEETLPSQGTTNGVQHMQFVNNVLGYSGGNAGTFLRCDVPSGILSNNGSVPEDYILTQNYPNPFNPVTKIEYALPQNSFVTLKVYDVTGKEVSELVDGLRSAGNYEINFDASNLNSGVYFYTLITEGFTETKKMLLIK